jgi:sugar O-acyltransferase (sialic acid O-acetyltransferase NeuD family)
MSFWIVCQAAPLGFWGLCVNDLVIFGAGGFGRSTHQVVEDINSITPTWNFRGFLDDALGFEHKLIHDHPCLGDLNWLRDKPGMQMVIAVGDPLRRMKIIERLEQFDVQFPNLVHPTAWVASRSKMGVGNIVCAGALIDTDVVIGDHCLINKGVTLGHDAAIADFCSLNPNATIGGFVRVGTASSIGMNCSIIQNKCIGEFTTIGAGTVVTANIPANSLAVGVPARIVRTIER